MSGEFYHGGNSGGLSRWQIQNMKKNMKKVPIIQEKSKQQHQKDEIDAEISFLDNLNKIQETTGNKIQNKHNERTGKKNNSRRKKFLYKIKLLLK